ncbi:MAG: hypothetical protein PHQ34_04330 [Methanothrix sp.]|nr:hypothetical protein [Methanothrix sp.]
MIKLNAKNAAALLIAMLFVLAFSASAQWSPGGSMVYMGDLNLAMSSLSSAKQAQSPASAPDLATANNTSENATSPGGINSTGSNAILLPAELGVGQANAADQPATSPYSGKKVLDLSGYAKDRVDRNLAGYTNIMYPISGSRGTTTSTAGGGGCGGGCGGGS